jgi:SsrA-binding protein
MSEKVIVNNRKARHDYQVLDSLEVGIALTGTEVKSLRTGGNMTLKDSYADVIKGECYLVGAHIPHYVQATYNNHDVERRRKLLLHKREIEKLSQKVAEKGLTLIPLRVYFKRGMVKLELGLCRGKNVVDKRDSIRDKESKREIDRALKETRKGG